MYPYTVLRCPTYRENSHANHTWHQHLQETACFPVPGLLPRGFDSHRPLHFQARQGYKIGLKTLIRSEGLGESTPRGRRSHGLTYTRCPEIHTYNHTQLFTRIICVIPTLLS